ncbi:MAG: hypothetical protein Ct9H300mP12_04760 [Acidimicrobiales bacterium]|nr:MAG: hypothetical protein Ct9H300mP12_04760 [Acidimicrobiales bacterium]
MTDRSGLISESTAAEVAEARISGVEHIPTLDELFETFPGTRINIDPKDDRVVGPLLRPSNAIRLKTRESVSDRFPADA